MAIWPSHRLCHLSHPCWIRAGKEYTARCYMERCFSSFDRRISVLFWAQGRSHVYRQASGGLQATTGPGGAWCHHGNQRPEASLRPVRLLLGSALSCKSLTFIVFGWVVGLFLHFSICCMPLGGEVATASLFHAISIAGVHVQGW